MDTGGLYDMALLFIWRTTSMVIIDRKLDGVTPEALTRFVNQARRAVGLTGDVNVLITSSAQLRDLNRRFRKKDKPTDVLSFPSGIEGAGGDIAISSDIAAQNSRQLGHALAMELKILALHGLLHLAGFDHETDNGKMARKERELRAQLGLADGLIERNLQPTPLRKKILSGANKQPASRSRRSRKR